MALAMALRPLSSAVDKTSSLPNEAVYEKEKHGISMEKSATLCRPKLIVDGAIDYARLYDYARIRKVLYDYADKINQAVFPGLQCGPHNHTITDLAVALKQATTPEYKAYQEQVMSNC